MLDSNKSMKRRYMKLQEDAVTKRKLLSSAKCRIVTTMCVSGYKGGNGRSVVGILRLDTGTGGTYIALFGHRPVPLLRVRGDSGVRPSGNCCCCCCYWSVSGNFCC